MQIDMGTKGKNLVHVRRANQGIMLTLPRSTGTSGDTTGTGGRGHAPSSGLTKASTMAAAGQDTAGTGAEVCPCAGFWLSLYILQ